MQQPEDIQKTALKETMVRGRRLVKSFSDHPERFTEEQARGIYRVAKQYNIPIASYSELTGGKKQSSIGRAFVTGAWQQAKKAGIMKTAGVMGASALDELLFDLIPDSKYSTKDTDQIRKATKVATFLGSMAIPGLNAIKAAKAAKAGKTTLKGTSLLGKALGKVGKHSMGGTMGRMGMRTLGMESAEQIAKKSAQEIAEQAARKASEKALYTKAKLMREAAKKTGKKLSIKESRDAARVILSKASEKVIKEGTEEVAKKTLTEQAKNLLQMGMASIPDVASSSASMIHAGKGILNVMGMNEVDYVKNIPYAPIPIYGGSMPRPGSYAPLPQMRQ